MQAEEAGDKNQSAGCVLGTGRALGGGVTDLVCVCMDPRRLGGWYLLLDSSHGPIRHQDELGGKRHIAAQGPVYLQQVPQLWLLGMGQVMWNERNQGGREKDRQRTTSRLQSNTRLQCCTRHSPQPPFPTLHCNITLKSRKQFPSGNKQSSVKYGPGATPTSCPGPAKILVYNLILKCIFRTG